jgi:hypothetical protein
MKKISIVWAVLSGGCWGVTFIANLYTTSLIAPFMFIGAFGSTIVAFETITNPNLNEAQE